MTDDELKLLVADVDTYGQRETARRWEIARTTVQYWIKRAAERGMLSPTVWTKELPPGFGISGVSTLTKTVDGKPQWIKVGRQRESYEQTVEVIRDTLADIPPVHLRPFVAVPRTDLLTLYPLADLHLGMYSWAEETGRSYDSDIAKTLMTDALNAIIARSPTSDTAVVLNLGDFFHADNDLARTLRSNNALDTDTRYARVLRIGVELTVMAIDLALERHKRVIYRSLRGNHDPYAALALLVGVEQRYFNEPRVLVDTDPSPFWVYKHGQTMLAATHGDLVKPDKIPGVMATLWPDIWGTTRYRYAHFGHVHHKSRGGEDAGAMWETHQTIAAKDAWHYGMGYLSTRSMCSITYNLDHGEDIRITKTVDWR